MALKNSIWRRKFSTKEVASRNTSGENQFEMQANFYRKEQEIQDENFSAPLVLVSILPDQALRSSHPEHPSLALQEMLKDDKTC